jgi:hypothetical protein
MSEEPISAAVAKSKFHVFARHGKMPNGESRFRLMDRGGDGYILTKSSSTGAWQNAHYHEKLTEIYVVAGGWMGYCEINGDAVIVKTLGPGETLSTKPMIPHNVYLPAGAVIHTVKLFSTVENDWHAHAELDQKSKQLNEADIHRMVAVAPAGDVIEKKDLLKPIMDHYINLDRLIWSIPTIMISAIAIFIGMIANLFGKIVYQDKPVAILVFSFVFVSIVSFIGFYSIHRMSFHHRIAGEEVFRIYEYNYFSRRNENLKRRPWASAHFLMKTVLFLLSIVFMTLFFLEITKPLFVNSALFPRPIESAPTSPLEGSRANSRAKLQTSPSSPNSLK